MRSILFLCVVLLTVSLLNSNNTKLPFNVHDVKEQISRYSTSDNRQLRYTWNSEGYFHQDVRSEEFLIDTNIVYVPEIGSVYKSSIAFDGTNFLVVGGQGEGRFSGIYCTRVNTLGVVLDTAGISIFSSHNGCWQPSVAFDGTNYLVVWVDRRNDQYGIYGTRLDTSGNVLDTNEIAISTSTLRHGNPCVVFGGTNYLVIWQEGTSNAYKIFGSRISTSGEVIDTSGIPISSEIGEHPSVAFDGTNYFVAWEAGHPRGARINQAGTVLDPTGILISTSGSEGMCFPSVAFDGTNYLVAWSDTSTGSYCILGARVSKTGTVLDSTGFQISNQTSGCLYSSISFDGTDYLVVWRGGPTPSTVDIYAARVSPDGIVLDTLNFPVSTAENDQTRPAVSFGGSKYLVAWSDQRFNFGYNVYGSRVETSGTVLDTLGIAIFTSANEQNTPSVAFDGTNYLVVWEDTRNGGVSNLDIYGTRVSQLGTILDPSGIAISIAASRQSSPSIVFGGGYYLVVWSDSRDRSSYDDVYGARINTLGTVLDSSGIAISDTVDSQNYPAVAFDGTNYLVVWEDERNNSGYPDIYAARVSTSGVILDPTGIPVSYGEWTTDNISVAFDGLNYLIVYRDRHSFTDVYGCRLTPAGGILDPGGFNISKTTNYSGQPSVTFGNNYFFVVWSEHIGAYQNDIYGARVTSSGLVLDSLGIPISTTVKGKYYPCVSFDGTDYFAIWEEWVEGPNSMFGTKVDISGHADNPFLIYSQDGDVASPEMINGLGSQLFLAWSSWTPNINGKPANAMRIWGKFDPHTSIEEKPENSHVENLKLQVYPNPCKQILFIKLEHPMNNKNVSLMVYDITGRCVKTFFKSKLLSPEPQLITWDGRDNSGNQVPSGVYFLRFKTEKYKVAKKLLMIK